MLLYWYQNILVLYRKLMEPPALSTAKSHVISPPCPQLGSTLGSPGFWPMTDIDSYPDQPHFSRRRVDVRGRVLPKDCDTRSLEVVFYRSYPNPYVNLTIHAQFTFSSYDAEMNTEQGIEKESVSRSFQAFQSEWLILLIPGRLERCCWDNTWCRAENGGKPTNPHAWWTPSAAHFELL
jgi:hypothetical protein